MRIVKKKKLFKLKNLILACCAHKHKKGGRLSGCIEMHNENWILLKMGKKELYKRDFLLFSFKLYKLICIIGVL